MSTCESFPVSVREDLDGKTVVLSCDDCVFQYQVTEGNMTIWTGRYQHGYTVDNVANEISSRIQVDKSILVKKILSLHLRARQEFEKKHPDKAEKSFKLESKPLNTIRKASLPDPDIPNAQRKLVEQVYSAEQGSKYAVYDLATGAMTYEDFIEIDGIRYEPIHNKDVKTLQVLLPRKAEEYTTTECLRNELRDFLNRWHEETNPEYREIDVDYVFLTYVKDLLPVVPYRRRLSGFGTGKSAWLETLGSICYRPFKLAGCDSEASIRRTFDLWRGTALIDEADFSKSDLYANIVKILNIGYDHNGWHRCCNDKDPSETLSFYVYGPKILACRREFSDTALESRFLSSTGKQNQSPRPLFRTVNFHNEALNLRNKLLMWRFRNWSKIKDTVRILEDPDIITKIFGEDLPVLSRIKQILMPLVVPAISVTDQNQEKLLTELKEMMIKLNDELIQKDPDIQLEYEINKALRKLLKSSEIRIHPILGGASVKISSLAMVILEESETADSRQKDKDTRTLSKEIARILRQKGLDVKPGAGNLTVVWLPPDVLKAKTLPTSYGLVNQVSEVSHITKGQGENPVESTREIHPFIPFPIIPYVKQLTSLTTLAPSQPKMLASLL